jgi:hypothetical protein
MMKWMFGLLLLVNVSFFAVMHWGAALTVDNSNPPLQAAVNADKIKMLAFDAGSAPASATSAASAVVASAVQVASPLPAAPEPVAPARAPAVPPVTHTPSPAVHAAAAPPAKAAPSGKLSCMEWGEFSGADLQRAEKALGTLHLEKHLKTRYVERGGAYWVYIAPVKSHAKVEKKIAQLKSLGVSDYFTIQEAGVWQNAISLGVFKSEEAARNYLAELKGLGVKSALVGKRASKLKLTVFVLDHLDGTMSGKLAELHKDFSESEIKTVSCGE